MNESPYKAPESSLDVTHHAAGNDRALSRRGYIGRLFLVWVVIPTVASLMVTTLGLGQGGITSNSGSGSASFHLDMLYVWYISLPLFIWFTCKRVKDTGMSAGWTILFILPLVNLVIWFWPPKR